MKIDTSSLNAKQIYHLMIQSILPRPIAWVLTRSDNQSLNLAPFSYFNGVSSDPPIIMISSGKKSADVKKDTWKNIELAKEFVVHIPCVGQERSVSESAESLDYGESEIDKFQLETEGVDGWNLPRLRMARVAFLCQLFAIHEIGEKPQALILGQIKSFWYANNVIKQDGSHYFVNFDQVDPLARLGHDDYGRIVPL